MLRTLSLLASIQLKCQEHDLPLSTVGLFSSINNHVFCTISIDIIFQNKMHCSQRTFQIKDIVHTRYSYLELLSCFPVKISKYSQ